MGCCNKQKRESECFGPLEFEDVRELVRIQTEVVALKTLRGRLEKAGEEGVYDQGKENGVCGLNDVACSQPRSFKGIDV